MPYEPLSHAHCLPAAVDWRGTPADGVVKDQAACGSCWAFGMTGAIHAAHYMATGAGLCPVQPAWRCPAPDRGSSCKGEE